MKQYKTLGCFVSLFLCIAAFAQSDTKTVIMIPITKVSPKGQGMALGSVNVTETKHGLLFTPNLHGLPPGAHGFHVHENPSCADNGNAAGGHLDPKKTGKHRGPYGTGHLGDLPRLIVNANGTVITPMLAPHLRKLSEIEHHSLMIHEGGDNYSDLPLPMGGGGARLACGVIP